MIAEHDRKKDEFYEKELKTRDEMKKDLENRPIEEKVIIQEKIIEQGDEIIDECIKDKQQLRDQLEEVNETLKLQNNLKNNIACFMMIGLDRDLEMSIYAGVNYRRDIVTFKRFGYFIGGGLAVEIYEKQFEYLGFQEQENILHGFAVELDTGFKF